MESRDWHKMGAEIDSAPYCPQEIYLKVKDMSRLQAK